MTDQTDEPIIAQPMEPEAINGEVHAEDPPAVKLKMTPDAAEISGIRLLDAAEKARRRT